MDLAALAPKPGSVTPHREVAGLSSEQLTAGWLSLLLSSFAAVLAAPLVVLAQV